MKLPAGIFGMSWPPVDKTLMGEGPDKTVIVHMPSVRPGEFRKLTPNDFNHAGNPPPVLRSASEKLVANLQRNVEGYTDREKELRREIAAREAELADVLKASAAACMALDALVDAGMAEAVEAELQAD